MKGITLQEMSDETVQQLQANYVRQPAYAHTEGTESAYTVTLEPAPTSLADGFGITIVPHVTNADNPTLNINGHGAIALKDQKDLTYAAGKLQAGKPYTFRKVGMDFLADSSGGSGNAVAGDIRAGKTATTDEGEVIGTLPVRTGGTVVPSTTNQTKQAGIYDTNIVVQGSASLIPNNIRQGANIFGVVGNVQPAISSPVKTESPTGTNFYVPGNSTVVLPKPTGISRWQTVLFEQWDGYEYNYVMGSVLGEVVLYRDRNTGGIAPSNGLYRMSLTESYCYITSFASSSRTGNTFVIGGS